ncbi:MAG TPA: GAF domain-containing protein [Vicinamibacterales bacterium]|nr:GAF domain-containing protein [Vicinamibacterales bacterium]
MGFREDRAPVWAIWLMIAFGVIQPILWTRLGGPASGNLAVLSLLVVWLALLMIAALAARRITWLVQTLGREERAHRAALNQVEQLQTQNRMLEIIASSVDVPLAFQELASRIIRLVPCDRAGLALLSDDGQEFQTYTARVHGDERRGRPRPEVVFKVDRTIIGSVVRSREPLVVGDMQASAADHLDANVVASAGFRSALIIPLVTKGRAVGTLNAVARRPDAFDASHVGQLQPIAELLAVAWVAQQLQMTRGKYRSMEIMAEATLSMAAEINSALQTIIGHCDLMERENKDAAVRRDLATIQAQAQRIADLLEKMREAARERLREASDTMTQVGMRPDPEG